MCLHRIWLEISTRISPGHGCRRGPQRGSHSHDVQAGKETIHISFLFISEFHTSKKTRKSHFKVNFKLSLYTLSSQLEPLKVHLEPGRGGGCHASAAPVPAGAELGSCRDPQAVAREMEAKDLLSNDSFEVILRRSHFDSVLKVSFKFI